MEVENAQIIIKGRQYVNIGDDIRIVFAGGTGKHCRLLIDAPKELNIARSNNETDPAKRKDTYYPEPGFSSEAKKQIKQIIWNEKERQKKTQQMVTLQVMLD